MKTLNLQESANWSRMKPGRLASTFSALAVMAGAFLLADSARATLTYDFDLGTGNSAISGYSGPYAQVEVAIAAADSTQATITFTSLSANGNVYLFGDSGVVGVNVNGTYTLGTVNELNGGTGYTPSYKDNKPGTEDGFGDFNLSLDNNDGNGDAADQISFTITKTSGTWASASDVLVANAGGSEAAAHIFVTSSPANAVNDALATGYAADGGAVVPEPATIVAGLLLLLPLGASAFRILRRRQTA